MGGSTSSGGLLGDLSGILSGYVQGRANLLLQQEGGSGYVSGTGYTSSVGSAVTSGLSSPMLWVGLAVVAVLVVVLVMRRK